MRLKRFALYGLLGWGLEIFWTGMGSAARGDVRLAGTTYLWMFPIYGLAVFLEPLHNKIRTWPWYMRGLVWLLVIWSIEYATGGLIRAVTGNSPWDYTGSTRWHLSGLIRLDMAPVWFATGLLFERVHDLLVKRIGL
jgi:uncharacterized membrane protein